MKKATKETEGTPRSQNWPPNTHLPRPGRGGGAAASRSHQPPPSSPHVLPSPLATPRRRHRSRPPPAGSGDRGQPMGGPTCRQAGRWLRPLAPREGGGGRWEGGTEGRTKPTPKIKAPRKNFVLDKGCPCQVGWVKPFAAHWAGGDLAKSFLPVPRKDHGDDPLVIHCKLLSFSQ